MVLPRILTAVVLAPLFLWALYLGGLPFVVFMALLILLALWEFHGMAETGGYATQGWAGWAGGALFLAGLVFPGIRTDMPVAGQAPAVALFLALALWTAREMGRRDKGLSLLRLAMSFAGVGLVVAPLGTMILARDLHGEGALFHAGRQAVFFLVALVWAQDTAAYAVGLTIGRHRLAPAISPKKSWEGALGGLLAAALAGLAFRELFMSDLFGRGEAVALAAGLGVLAQMSDLLESMMKRCFGVKDSSALLPGHGGILDRFDSFILSAPLLYFYLIASGRVQ